MALRILVTGAAGFIGSRLSELFLERGDGVIAIDNLVRGRAEFLCGCFGKPGFEFVRQDLADLAGFRRVVANAGRIDAVWHLAANSDIQAGVADPAVDLRNTFLTTYNTVAIMREWRIPAIAFASTSAIYGDLGKPLAEDTGPLLPVSNYGAMKLASEAIISAAVESFLERAWIFRFPNVVGPRATHGIIYDLTHKLRHGAPELEVLGNGCQQKPYLHLSELLEAMLVIEQRSGDRICCFNIGPLDEGARVSYIAEAVVRTAAPGTPIRYTGGSKGWVGDVPRFRYSIDKLVALGWRPKLSSEQAIDRAVAEIWSEAENGCNS